MIGRFPILDISPVTHFGGELIGAKAIPNEEIPVQATIIREGHDGFEAHVVLVDPRGKEISRVAMREIWPKSNRFEGRIRPTTQGLWSFYIEVIAANPGEFKKTLSSSTEKLEGFDGSVLAVSDFMRTVQDQIAPWVPQPFTSLGTDGFGLSDTRGALRRHFKVDAESIVVGVLAQLAKEGKISAKVVKKAIEKYQLTSVTAADPGNTEGTG